MNNTSFRAIVECGDHGQQTEVVAEVRVRGPYLDILHLHNDESYRTTDAEDVEAFKAKFYEREAGVI